MTSHTPAENDDFIDNYVSRIFRISEDKPEWHTVPLAFLQNGKLVIDRTVVLLRIGDAHFAVTAAHDFQAILKAGCDPYLLKRRPEPPIPMRIESMFATEDVSDVAVARLRPETAALLEQDYRFLTLTDVKRRDSFDPKDCGFLLTGFAHSRETHDDEGNRRIDVWRHIAAFYPLDLGVVLDYNPRLHLIVEYQRDTKSRKTGTVVLPHGLSGCGIWYLHHNSHLDALAIDDVKLVAIQTKWSERHEYAKGTWIDIPLQLIWMKFPEVRPAMRLHGIEFTD